MLQEADAPATGGIGPDVLFASQVLDLKLHAVQLSPGGGEAQKGAERLGGSKETVDTTLS